MIINTGLASNLAVAADKSIAQEGDDITIVPSVILPTDKILAPHHVLGAALGRTAQTSFLTFFEKLRAASTGATADIIVTLVRGLWTIGYNFNCRFQSAGVANGTAAVKFLISMESDTQLIAAVFRAQGPNFQHGMFRLLLKENADLRLDVVATGAGDAIDTTIQIQAERNIG